MNARIAFLAMTAATLSGCGGGISNSVSGTIRGQSMKVNDAASTQATITTPLGPGTAAAILLTSGSNLCVDATANKEPKNSQYFVILLAAVNQSSFQFSAASQAGDYSVYLISSGGVPPKMSAVVLAATTDANCAEMASLDASGISGTVHLTGVSNGAYTGSFTVTMSALDSNGHATGAADQVSGSFNTPNCAGLGPLVSTTRSTTCI